MLNRNLKTIGLLVLGLFISSCGMEFRGQLNVQEGQRLVLRDNFGRDAELKSGRLTVKTDGNRDIFNALVNITSEDHRWTILIPKKSFASKADSNQFDFEVSGARINQPVDISSKGSKNVVSVTYETGVNQCTYSGYCCEAGLGYDGKYGAECSFKPSCSGLQDAVFEVVKSVYNVQLEFKNPQTKELIGQFTSDPTPVTQKFLYKTLESCR